MGELQRLPYMQGPEEPKCQRQRGIATPQNTRPQSLLLRGPAKETRMTLCREDGRLGCMRARTAAPVLTPLCTAPAEHALTNPGHPRPLLPTPAHFDPTPGATPRAIPLLAGSGGVNEGELKNESRSYFTSFSPIKACQSLRQLYKDKKGEKAGSKTKAPQKWAGN